MRRREDIIRATSITPLDKEFGHKEGNVHGSQYVQLSLLSTLVEVLVDIRDTLQELKSSMKYIG